MTLSRRDRNVPARRFELRLPTTPPFEGAEVAGNELLLSATKLLLLSDTVSLDTHSAVISLPGCTAGHWHADVEDPFQFYSPVVRGAAPFPPPGLVAVVPLVPVNATNGPTAFRVGSHVRPAGVPRGERDEANSLPELPIAAAPGTAVLFDLRLTHRGGANTGDSPRPILYLGYTQRWFADVANFKGKQTAAWARLATRTRRALFARVDAQAYIATLERELRARGVDVAALSADGLSTDLRGGLIV